MNLFTIAALVLLGGIAAYSVLLANAWRKEAIAHHEGKMRLTTTTFAILNAVMTAANKMDLANHKDAAAILLSELESVKEGVVDPMKAAAQKAAGTLH